MARPQDEDQRIARAREVSESTRQTFALLLEAKDLTDRLNEHLDRVEGLIEERKRRE